MDEAEFDRFADEYRLLHARNIRASGEPPEFFAEYKVADVARLVSDGTLSQPTTILDFGAGVGTSVPYFKKFFPRATLTCLDVSRRSLGLGRALFEDAAEFVHFDGKTIPYARGYFDFAFVACVLHHIPTAEHRGILNELKRILRPGGGLVLFEHNPYNPLTVRAVKGCPFDENAVLIRPGRLQRVAVAAGFAKVTIRYRIFFPHFLRSLRPLERRLTRLPLGAQYCVHARKDALDDR